MNRALWFCLPFSPCLCAEIIRDPFQAATLFPCSLAKESPTHWLLKGIIGEKNKRSAWVLTPTGQWLQLQSQQYLLAGTWQVGNIYAQQLELQTRKQDEQCPDNSQVILKIPPK